LKIEYSTKNDPKINDTMAESLIKIFNEGPEVSFNGSPTVSPTTAALCGSDFFLKNPL
jgi:hypothetical protein